MCLQAKDAAKGKILWIQETNNDNIRNVEVVAATKGLEHWERLGELPKIYLSLQKYVLVFKTLRILNT